MGDTPNALVIQRCKGLWLTYATLGNKIKYTRHWRREHLIENQKYKRARTIPRSGLSIVNRVPCAELECDSMHIICTGQVSRKKPPLMNFSQVNILALSLYPDRLFKWLPNDVLDGTEFLIGSLRGEGGRSLSINIGIGVWKDFTSGEGGCDLLH